MIRQTYPPKRGFITLLTTVMASLLLACGCGETSSPETEVPIDSVADTIADNSELDSKGSTASLTLDDETIVFSVEICSNPGGGTFTFIGSTTREDGKSVHITVRSISGQSQAFIKLGPPGSADAWEWRGGSETTSASIDGDMLTASGEAVGLDPSTGAFTEQTRRFSISGPCVSFMNF